MQEEQQQKTVWSPEEREIARPPEEITTAEWAERNRELSTLTSASAGAYSLGAVPFFRGILDAIDDRDIETVVIQKSTQIGGTELVISWLGRCADQDPGPAMIVLADEDTANEICERRIQPMIRSTPALRRLIVESKFNQNQITLRNNFSLTMAWASSIARTASRPIRYLVMDEITKPGYNQAGTEGDVIGRVEQRTETFPNRKKVMLSTPTAEDDNLDKQMQGCDAVYDYHVPCPKCGAYQPLRFSPQEYTDEHGQKKVSGSVVWQQGRPIAEAAETALYQCGECKCTWTTAEKNSVVERGRWIARRGAKGKRVGFYISRLYSLFPGGRLENLARDFLDCEGNPAKLQVFVNNALGEHWKRHKITKTDDELRKAETDLPAGVVPYAADCLVATIDMQMHGFWYLVRAWQASPRKSWLIECGELGTWDDVDNLLFEQSWQKENGRHFNIWRAGIDSGGGKDEGSLVSRTEELYSWYIKNRARAYGKAWLCKGSSRAMPQILNVGKVLASTPSGKKIDSYGLRIVTLSTQELKRLFLHGLEQAIEKGSQAAYLHKDMPPQYYRHITAEAETDSGDFERIRPDNHLFDCEATQYAMVNRLLFGGVDRFVRTRTQPEHQQEQLPEPEQQPAVRRVEYQEPESTILRRY